MDTSNNNDHPQKTRKHTSSHSTIHPQWRNPINPDQQHTKQNYKSNRTTNHQYNLILLGPQDKNTLHQTNHHKHNHPHIQISNHNKNITTINESDHPIIYLHGKTKRIRTNTAKFIQRKDNSYYNNYSVSDQRHDFILQKNLTR